MLEEKKNKDLLSIVIRPDQDFGVEWQASLRQHEHDLEYDGIPRRFKNTSALGHKGTKVYHTRQNGKDSMNES